MSASNPRRAVIEFLDRRGTELPLAPLQGGPELSQPANGRPPPTPGVSVGGLPYAADIGTLHFLVEREVGGRHFIVVTFEADHARFGRMAMYSSVMAERDESGGWLARGLAGGSGTGSETPPHWTKPRVGLAGPWGRTGFRGAGRIHNVDADLTRVRLTFSGGPRLEDEAQEGWVFFFTEEPVGREVTVEPFDNKGEVLASHPWRLGIPGRH